MHAIQNPKRQLLVLSLTIVCLLIVTFVSFLNFSLATQNFKGVNALAAGTSPNPTTKALNDFGTLNGWTTQYQYPKGVADLNGDGFDDVYGFGNQGVWVATNKNKATSDLAAFNPSQNVYAGFDTLGGYFNQDFVPRFVEDVNGDGLKDILGLSSNGTKYVLNNKLTPLNFGGFNAETNFSTPNLNGIGNTVYSDFNISIGWSDMIKYPRFVKDINNDTFTDIVGFGQDGVWASYGSAGGNMARSKKVLNDFGVQQGWSNTFLYPRDLADVNGDTYLDIVGFGQKGVWVAENNKLGGFLPSKNLLNDFDVVTGWSNSNLYPRYVVDVNGDNFADIVGFGQDGVWVAENNKLGGFLANQGILKDFGTQKGWASQYQYPRFIGNLDGDKYLDIVGFGQDGVWTNNDFFNTAVSSSSSTTSSNTTSSNGSTSGSSSTPLTFSAVSAGFEHTCGILSNGNLRCWGLSNFGQLGYGVTNERRSPTGDVNLGGASINKIFAGRYRTCGIFSAGNLRCWGYNGYGHLGYGDLVNRNTVPLTDVNFGSATVTSVALGTNHTCALLSTGSVRCWGDNGIGQLGYGDNIQRNSPGVDINLGGISATAITAGFDHTCALLSTGSVRCWGRNGNSQLGYGDYINRSSPGADINLGGVLATKISAGDYHTCVLLATGSVSCWGMFMATSPTKGNVDTGGEKVVDIDAGENSTCAILSTGSVRCWGTNSRGQLGVGDYIDKEKALINVGLGGVSGAGVSVGAQHACALLSNSYVRCWGYNSHGQLGIGNTGQLTTPGNAIFDMFT